MRKVKLYFAIVMVAAALAGCFGNIEEAPTTAVDPSSPEELKLACESYSYEDLAAYKEGDGNIWVRQPATINAVYINPIPASEDSDAPSVDSKQLYTMMVTIAGGTDEQTLWVKHIPDGEAGGGFLPGETIVIYGKMMGALEADYNGVPSEKPSISASLIECSNSEANNSNSRRGIKTNSFMFGEGEDKSGYVVIGNQYDFAIDVTLHFTCADKKGNEIDFGELVYSAINDNSSILANIETDSKYESFDYWIEVEKSETESSATEQLSVTTGFDKDMNILVTAQNVSDKAMEQVQIIVLFYNENELVHIAPATNDRFEGIINPNGKFKLTAKCPVAYSSFETCITAEFKAS